MPNSRLPTPNSAENDATSRAAKRRRISNNAETPTRGSDDEDLESVEEDSPTPSTGEDQVEDVTDSLQTGNTSIDESARFYDPKQDPAERQWVKAEQRTNEREFMENRDQHLRGDNDGICKTLEKQNNLFIHVKQTADATTDSRLLVNVSDVAHRKSAQLAMSDGATGIDVDEFVSKFISYGQRGARESNSITISQRRRMNDDGEEDENIIDWAYLGARACFPYNSRPPVPGFLLGPLSVQKRVRAPTQRRARQQDDGRAETRPEAFDRDQLPSTDTTTVRHFCSQIKNRLIRHSDRAIALAKEEADDASVGEEEFPRILRKHRITAEGGPSLFDFAINPHSFGQTVENLFYISFLIKEGEVEIVIDDPEGDAQPVLLNRHQAAEEESARGSDRTKHQAVFGIDYKTWQDLIEAYNIKESLIPHREEGGQTQLGRGGWYT
ncbi:Nse4 C-terminal-domain-containing protein [Elsinoe ampelina]|uniref:Non-structural maintenance of chromosomes element 4 n=1 Tax=Elsinoe ampelina TaxID=302913 RepID=A0A6A6GI01_9PEZI|nr:Nse4 C-terminal-domain-containing protein [Elsinoe ampelina]